MTWLSKLRSVFGRDSPAPATPEQQFQAEMAERVGAFANVERIEPIPNDFGLNIYQHGSDKPVRVFLGNLFEELRELDPEARERSCQRFLSVMLDESEPLTDWSDVRDAVLPVIRSAAFAIDLELQPVRESLLPCLARFVVVDTDDKMVYATRFQLDDWGVDFSEAYQTALERLADLKHTIDRYGAPNEALWHLIDGDTYESSRLLLPVWRKRVQEALGKKLAFAIPERATLLMAPVDDVAALTRLQEIAAREYAAAPRRLSPDLYAEAADGELRALQLPPEHAMTRTLVLRRLQFVVGEYNEQAATLQPSLEDERYVAEAVPVEQDGELSSMTVWTQDVPSLLPFTEHVGLQGKTSEGAEPWRLRVRFDDLVREGERALQRIDEHGLPWLKTLRPLDTAELAALRACSTPRPD